MRFYAQGPRYEFHLSRDAAMLSFMEDARATRGVTLGLRFIGGNPDVVIEGERRATGDVNYLRGNDPAQWRTALPRHSQIVYRELWPGIDMMLRGEAGTLKYEFRVQPGARDLRHPAGLLGRERDRARRPRRPADPDPARRHA